MKSLTEVERAGVNGFVLKSLSAFDNTADSILLEVGIEECPPLIFTDQI
jgi:hypothetical protein